MPFIFPQQAFLMSKFNLSEDDVPSDASLRRWHPAFQLDTAVAEVETGPLPPRPSEEDNKITSASEAVAAFRARALFREAQLCEKLCPTIEIATPIKIITAPVVAPAKNLKGISESLLARVCDAIIFSIKHKFCNHINDQFQET